MTKPSQLKRKRRLLPAVSESDEDDTRGFTLSSSSVQNRTNKKTKMAAVASEETSKGKARGGRETQSFKEEAESQAIVISSSEVEECHLGGRDGDEVDDDEEVDDQLGRDGLVRSRSSSVAGDLTGTGEGTNRSTRSGLRTAGIRSQVGAPIRASALPPPTGSSRRRKLIQDESDSDGDAGASGGSKFGGWAASAGSARSSRRK